MKHLINIVCTPHMKPDTVEKIHQFWSTQANDAVPEFKQKRVETKDDGTHVLPWELATKVMAAQMTAMKRINNGGRVNQGRT